MEKVEIDINQPLSPGDIVELHFKTLGMVWIQAAQITAIEWWFKITKPPWEILSWSIPEDTKVIFKVRVKKTNPVIVTVAVIAAAICAVGVVAWLTLDKAYQIIESPAGETAVSSFGLLTIILAVGIGIWFLKTIAD